MHVHVISSDGEAKYRVEPNIELAANYSLSARDLNKIEVLIREREQEIAWQRHFGS